METKHYSVDALRSQIREIVSRHLDIDAYEVFFFGSRVSGNHSERSDIDVGIDGPNPIPSHTMARIREEIEEISTLYTIEVVDFQSVSEEFVRQARKATELI